LSARLGTAAVTHTGTPQMRPRDPVVIMLN